VSALSLTYERTCGCSVAPDLPQSRSVDNQVSPLSCSTPSVITSSKSLPNTSKRWLSSYRMSLIYYYRYLVSNVLFRKLAGQKRKHNIKPKNRILNYEISTSISFLSFGYIILCLFMNPDVIKGLDIGELASHY
jgi:hypothetical protein